MKRIITIALAGVFAMIFSGAAMADMGMDMKDGKTMQEKMAKKRTDWLQKLTKQLTLTMDQQTQIEAILKANDEQKMTVKTKMDTDLKAVKESENAQIKAVLTPEQQTKYEKMMMEKMKKMEKR